MERDRHPGAAVTNEGPRPRVVEESGQALSREACRSVIVSRGGDLLDDPIPALGPVAAQGHPLLRSILRRKPMMPESNQRLGIFNPPLYLLS